MEPNNEDVQEVQETPENAENSASDQEVTPEELADLKKKADASSKNFERLKKLEAENKKLKESLEPETQDLSQKDILYLAKADIHEDDLEDVLRWAKNNKISVKDAHKEYQPILEKRAEHRKTAEAANTKTARPSSKQSSDADVLRNAEKGTLPEKGSDEAEKLFWARRGGRPS